MTTSEQRTRRSSRAKVGKNLFNTIPIVLAGSMAVGLGLTGPIEPLAPKKAEKPKSTPSVLARTIKTAFASAAKSTASTITSAATSPAATTVSAAPTTYVVVAGDTVSSIAGHYGLATASVLALNGLGWKSVIFPGQQLKLTSSGAVPVAATPVATSGLTRYTIASGDTMGKIAARFGTTTATLLSANGLGWSSIIYPGQSIVIPGALAPAAVAVATPVAAVAPATTGGSYVIRSGDTISRIAAKNGMSSQALLAANGLTLSSVIYAGRSLVIPGATAAPAIMLASSATSILSPEMTTDARTIITVGRSLRVPDYGIVIALATALQESGLRNLHYGDRDSLGVFQQRPSTGWGTASQLLDTTYSARLFFGGKGNPNAGNTKGLLDIAGWQSMSVTNAAQAVQRSGFPSAYAEWETTARMALASLG